MIGFILPFRLSNLLFVVINALTLISFIQFDVATNLCFYEPAHTNAVTPGRLARIVQVCKAVNTTRAQGGIRLYASLDVGNFNMTQLLYILKSFQNIR